MPSKSEKQHNFMQAVAHNPAFAKRAGVPQSVGKEFAQADKGLKFKGAGTRADLQKINSPKTDHGKSGVMARGGEVKESKQMMKKEVAFMKKKGAPKSMVKHEMAEMTSMKSGGRMPSRGEHAVQKQSKRGAEMVKMASGGLASGHKSADGIAKKGKTRAMQVKMAYGGKAC